MDRPEGETTAFADLPPKLRAAKFRELAYQTKWSAARAEGQQRASADGERRHLASAGKPRRARDRGEQRLRSVGPLSTQLRG